MNAKKQLLIYLILNRLFILSFGTLIHKSVRDYDLSSSNSIFLKWDSIYFIDIAKNGYTFENELAFYPGFPILIRIVKKLMMLDVSYEFCSILINFVCYVVNCFILFDLTVAVGFSNDFAYRTSLFWCISPISIFSFAPYSESLFSLLSFFGMLMMTKKRYFLAFISFFLSGFVRSNGMISAGFMFYEVLTFMIQFNNSFGDNIYTKFVKCILRIKPKISFKMIILFSFGLLLVVPSILFYLYSNKLFCPGAEWCGHSHYGYVQNKYWGVGFLKYWRISQIPNILLAFPICYFCFCFLKYMKNTKNTIIFPYLVHLSFLLCFSLLFAHVQVTTRLILSASPSSWWALALKNNKVSKIYCLLYLVIGTSLFVNFLPWT